MQTRERKLSSEVVLERAVNQTGRVLILQVQEMSTFRGSDSAHFPCRFYCNWHLLSLVLLLNEGVCSHPFHWGTTPALQPALLFQTSLITSQLVAPTVWIHLFLMAMWRVTFSFTNSNFWFLSGSVPCFLPRSFFPHFVIQKTFPTLPILLIKEFLPQCNAIERLLSLSRVRVRVA